MKKSELENSRESQACIWNSFHSPYENFIEYKEKQRKSKFLGTQEILELKSGRERKGFGERESTTATGRRVEEEALAHF